MTSPVGSWLCLSRDLTIVILLLQTNTDTSIWIQITSRLKSKEETCRGDTFRVPVVRQGEVEWEHLQRVHILEARDLKLLAQALSLLFYILPLVLPLHLGTGFGALESV